MKKPRNPPVAARLGEKLLKIRKSNDLTTEEMLRIILPEDDPGNRSRISHYERGRRVPTLVEVYRYARFAGVTMETLVNDEFDLPEYYLKY